MSAAFAHDTISARAERALDLTDRMSPALRECVHEYGYAIVQACLNAKVTEPRRIHQLVRDIWEGARQPAQRRERAGMLDWILLQAGAGISAATLMRVLANSGLAIVPASPTVAMIEASKNEVSDFSERMTKGEKHRRRLMAANKAGAANLRPQLISPLMTDERTPTRSPAAESNKSASSVIPTPARPDHLIRDSQNQENQHGRQARRERECADAATSAAGTPAASGARYDHHDHDPAKEERLIPSRLSRQLNQAQIGGGLAPPPHGIPPSEAAVVVQGRAG